MRQLARQSTLKRICAVCERTLLTGERATRFSPDGEDFVDVCPLCQEIAVEQNWLKEENPTTPVVPTGRPRRQLSSLFERARPQQEEPIASDEPETLRAHLMANTIEPAAKRELAGMLRAGDERSTSVKLQLDALAHARETGDWEAVQRHAVELLGWVGEGTRRAVPAWREVP